MDYDIFYTKFHLGVAIRKKAKLQTIIVKCNFSIL